MNLLSSLSGKYISGKTALVRCDLNVEHNKNSLRLEAVIPTVEFLFDRGAFKVVVLSHYGRPDAFDAEIQNSKLDRRPGRYKIQKKTGIFTLKTFARVLSKKIRRKVVFVPHLDFGEIKKTIEESRESIFLIENLRFWKGEKKNSLRFAEQLASLGDFYINDAFSVSHRKNASVCAIVDLLPSYAGLRLEKEMRTLNGVMESKKHPLALIVGGAKIADKIGIIGHFKNRADCMLLCGGVANTYFAAAGVDIKDSLYEPEKIEFVKKFLKMKKIIVPADVRWFGRKIWDVGPKTEREYTRIILGSKVIIWSGPVGFYEKKGFEKGTRAVWNAVLTLAKKDPDAVIVVGGGETIAASRLISNFKSKISKTPNVFLSTGGGAMLKYLSGKKLPGIEALR